MTYGFESYDGNGRLQFSTEDPGMFVDSFTTSTPSTESTGGGDGNEFEYYIDILGVDQKDLIIARPVANQGFIGMLSWGTTRRLYSGGVVGDGLVGAEQGLSSLGAGIKWAVVKNAISLTPGGGYGLEVYNASEELTFSSNLAPGSAWLSVIGIVGRSALNNGTDTLKLKTIATPTSFANTYGIMNGHEYRYTEEGESPLFDDYRHQVHCRSFYWDPTPGTISASCFNFDYTGYSITGWTGNYTYPTTFLTDYIAVQAFGA